MWKEKLRQLAEMLGPILGQLVAELVKDIVKEILDPKKKPPVKLPGMPSSIAPIGVGGFDVCPTCGSPVYTGPEEVAEVEGANGTAETKLDTGGQAPPSGTVG